MVWNNNNKAKGDTKRKNRRFTYDCFIFNCQTITRSYQPLRQQNKGSLDTEAEDDSWFLCSSVETKQKKNNKTTTLNAPALIPVSLLHGGTHFFLGQFPVALNYSSDCNHSWHNDSLSSDDVWLSWWQQNQHVRDNEAIQSAPSRAGRFKNSKKDSEIKL